MKKLVIIILLSCVWGLSIKGQNVTLDTAPYGYGENHNMIHLRLNNVFSPTATFEWDMRIGTGAWTNLPQHRNQFRITAHQNASIGPVGYRVRIITWEQGAPFTTMERVIQPTNPTFAAGTITVISACADELTRAMTYNISSLSAATNTRGVVRYSFEVCYIGEPCDNATWRNERIFRQEGFEMERILENTTSTFASNIQLPIGRAVAYIRRVVVADGGTPNFTPTEEHPTLQNTIRYKARVSAIIEKRFPEIENLSPGIIRYNTGEENTVICSGGARPSTINVASGIALTGAVPITYRWERSTNNGATWTLITGQNSETLQGVTITQPEQIRRVTQRGCAAVFSNTLRATVAQPTPGFIHVPILEDTEFLTVCHNTSPGRILNFQSGNSNGLQTTYVWEQSTNGGATWTNIPNESGTEYTAPPLTQNTRFRRGIRGIGQGCPVVYASAVTVNVHQPNQAGTITIGSQLVCSGTSGNQITGTAQTGGNPLQRSYTWQSSINGQTWSTVSGATQIGLTLNNQTQNLMFRRLDNSGCGVIPTNTVQAQVFNIVTAGEIGSSHSVCYDGQPNILANITTPTGGNGSYIFRWETSVNNGPWTVIAGANQNTYQPPTLRQTTRYRRVVITNCGEAVSNVVIIGIAEPLNGGSISLINRNICYNENPDIIVNTLNASGGTGAMVYQWQVSFNNEHWQDIAGATGINYDPSNLTSSVFIRRRVTNQCGVAFSNTINIIVRSELAAPQIGSDQLICFNSVPEVINVINQATGGFGGYELQWEQSSNRTDWQNIIGQTRASLQGPALTSKAYYRLRVTDQCGVVSSNIVTINTTQVLSPGEIGSNQNVCFGLAAAPIAEIVSATGGMGSHGFRWEKREGQGQWSVIAGENRNIYNPGVVTQTTSYRRIVINGCGEVTSNVITVNVTPEFKPGAIAHKGVVCAGEIVGVLRSAELATGGFGNITYQFEKSNNGQTWNTVSGAFAETNYGIITGNTYFRRIARTQGCPNVVTIPIRVTIDPVRAQFTVSQTIKNVGESVQFICQSSNAVSRLWSFSEGEQRTDVSPWVFFNSPGQISATLTVLSRNNCVSSLTLNNVIELRLPTSSTSINHSDFILSPNPTDHAFTINSANLGLIQYVVIKNMQGQIVYHSAYFGSHINVSHLEPGVYFVSVMFSNEVIIQKLIIQ